MISNTPSVQIIYRNPLEVAYRELLALREQVRKVEATAALKTIRRALSQSPGQSTLSDGSRSRNQAKLGLQNRRAWPRP
jgi:hypothetical protein